MLKDLVLFLKKKLSRFILAPVFWSTATRPRRETIKNIIFPFRISRFIWQKEWQEWQQARIWLDSKQKNQLYWWYPFIIKKSYKVAFSTTFSTSNTTGTKSNNYESKITAAILIHVFYVDVFENMLNSIYTEQNSTIPLYITVNAEIEQKVVEILRTRGIPSFKVVCVENRGRDIGAFLKILPVLHKDGIQYVLKMHTKKSLHLKSSKKTWLGDIVNKLILDKGIDANFKLFNDNPDIGMIAPYGHILPMAFYYGLNSKNVVHLSSMMSIPHELLGSTVFVAGSMFYIKLAAITQLIQYEANNPIKFEDEQGQTDGTTAHAIERIFCLLCQRNGYKVIDTNYSEGKEAYTVISDYTHAR